MQTFVLGMHRSGTSALARVLNLMGFYFGGENAGTGRSDENVKGFWERRDVRDLNDDILFNSRCDWDFVSNFDLDAIPVETRTKFISGAGDIVLNLDAHRPWFVKEPRLCLLFPIWRQVLETPFCIHVSRNPLEIAHSLKARNKIPIRAGLALWEIYNLHALRASAGVRRTFISYEDLMTNVSTVVEHLHAVLSEAGGYRLRIPSGDELDHFLDDSLYRHRRTDRSLRSVATASQLALYEGLRGGAQALGTYTPPDPPHAALETLQGYERSVDIGLRIETARGVRQRRTPEDSSTRLKLANLDLEHARSLAKEVEQRLSETRRETRELRRTEMELRTALARSEQKAEDLSSALDGARQTARRREEERSSLRNLRAELEKRRAVLEETNRNLQGNVADLKQERSVLEAANAESEATRIAAEQTSAGLREELAELEKRRAVLEETNRNLQGNVADLRQERSVLEAANAESEATRVAAEQTSAGLREELAELEKRRAVLEETNRNLQGNVADLRQERSVLEAANAESEATRVAAEQTSAGLHEDLAELEKHRAVLEETNRNLQGNVADLRQARSVLEAANAESEASRVVAEQTSAGLREELAERTRESEALNDANAALERVKSSLEQSNASLVEKNDGLRLEQTILHEANARLEETAVELEQARARVEEEHTAIVARLRRTRDELSSRQSQAKDTVSRWDHELSYRKDAVSALALLASALHFDIAALLASRRWRLGRAIVSSLYLLSFRRIPKDVGERLSVANAAYRAKEQLIGDFATSRDDIPRKLAELAPTTDECLKGVFDFSELRAMEMNVRLVERALELKRRAQQIRELSAHIESLATIFEGILGSWRWRLGDIVISTLYRLVRGNVPATAAVSAATLVERYRMGSYVDLTTGPVVPMPGPDEQGATGGPDEVTPSIGIEPPVVDAAESTGNQVRPAARPDVSDTRVDIVVCVHNALDDVKRCLESVLSRTAIEFSLIVVNDGSGPETTSWLRQLSDRHPSVELVETDGPLGYTGAANLGLRAGNAPFVVLLNSDTIVPRLWVESLLECLRGDDKLGIVGPLSNAASWQSVPERFAEGGGWAINSLPAGYNVDEYSELIYRISDRTFPRVEFLNGFCLLMRRDVIKAIGYLDDVAFPRGYGEENDYCIRAREAGFQLAIADHCFVYHAKSRSFGEETRDRLAEEGRKALCHKYSSEIIEQGINGLKENPDLARMRSKVSSLFAPWGEREVPGRPADDIVQVHMRVLFVLPVRGGSGGANSVVQEVVGMRSLGVDACIAVDARHAESMDRFYADILEPGGRIAFACDEELATIAARFDVLVATLWSTPALIAPIADRWPDKAYVYYVQDYEPWFFPNDPESRTVALDSYTRLPKMALMAKTDWICRTVREHHDVEVFRVAPSLDHDVYHPASKPRGSTVTVAAMIRPATPRRAPRRTLRVLRDLALRFDGLHILLFGCESDALQELVRGEPDLNLDFAFENRGILTRRDVAHLLRESDIFLDLSDYQAFGRTGLEAMACGCATVLPAHGGANEYVVDGENAFLVDTASLEDMTSTVERLVADRPLRESLQERALATAARYSILRASLSELSVFRWVLTVARDGGITGDVYRRGVEPLPLLHGHAPEREVLGDVVQ